MLRLISLSKPPPDFMGSQFAYVTLLTTTSYLAGVLVLDYCLHVVHSKYSLVVMVTPSLPESARAILRKRNIRIREVERLQPMAGRHVLHAHDARFTDTWTKLRIFELVEYSRVILLDSDMIILKNMDELMSMELPHDHIAAVHVCSCNPRGLAHYPEDWIPSHCAYASVKHPTSVPPKIQKNSPRPHSQLNSGTVVLNPSMTTSASIYRFLKSSPMVSEWTFPDQDLLSEHFKAKWKPIPWYYNALRSSRNVHPGIWVDHEIRCLHYIFADKPWQSRKMPNGSDAGFDLMNRWWWERFDRLGEQMLKRDPEGWRFVVSCVDAGHFD